MKVFILFAVIAASQAAVLLGGASEQFRSEDGDTYLSSYEARMNERVNVIPGIGNYAFGYNEGHGTGATFRKESGSPGAVVGSYGLSDADGRRRVVNYVADAAGFRADIKTNEPGVEPKDPAHTAINKAAAVIAPVAHYAAPIHHAASVHHAVAPVAHHSAAIAHHAPAHYAGHPFGAFAYNTAIGHHGVGHHGYYW